MSGSSASQPPPEDFKNRLLSEQLQTKNDFCALRHGQSMANVEGLIASNPQVAIHKYGLSKVGQQQAQKAGQDVVDRFKSFSKQQQHPLEKVLILTSDLLRAKETAAAVANACIQQGVPLYQDRLVIDTRLRERRFGNWDLKSDVHYQDVWDDDAKDPFHTINEVESVMSVMDRSTQCVIEWNDKVENHLIVCTAHGDVLQILQTAFSKLDGSKHRSLEHLETATLRPLELKL